jgi:hypothetical protein
MRGHLSLQRRPAVPHQVTDGERQLAQREVAQRHGNQLRGAVGERQDADEDARRHRHSRQDRLPAAVIARELEQRPRGDGDHGRAWLEIPEHQYDAAHEKRGHREEAEPWLQQQRQRREVGEDNAQEVDRLTVRRQQTVEQQDGRQDDDRQPSQQHRVAEPVGHIRIVCSRLSRRPASRSRVR